MPRHQQLAFDFGESIAYAKLWREQRSDAERDDENQFVVDGCKELGRPAAKRALEEKLHHSWHIVINDEKARERVAARMAAPLSAEEEPPSARFELIEKAGPGRAPEETPWAEGYLLLRQINRIVRGNKPVDVSPDQLRTSDLRRALSEGLEWPIELLRYFRSEWLPNRNELAAYDEVLAIIKECLEPVRLEIDAVRKARFRREMKPDIRARVRR